MTVLCVDADLAAMLRPESGGRASEHLDVHLVLDDGTDSPGEAGGPYALLVRDDLAEHAVAPVTRSAGVPAHVLVVVEAEGPGPRRTNALLAVLPETIPVTLLVPALDPGAPVVLPAWRIRPERPWAVRLFHRGPGQAPPGLDRLDRVLAQELEVGSSTIPAVP